MSGSFDRKYDDQQKEAMYRLYVVEDRTAGETKRLIAGGFADCEPIDASIHTIRYIANAIRDKREGRTLTSLAQGSIDKALETLARRSISVFDQELERIESDTSKTKPVDPDRFTGMLKAQKELASLAKLLPRAPQSPPKPAAGEDPTDAMSRLMGEHRSSTRGHVNGDS